MPPKKKAKTAGGKKNQKRLLEPNNHLQNAIELWLRYMSGYCRGVASVKAPEPRCIGMRAEDLVVRPVEVLKALVEKVGLRPRAGVPFQPLKKWYGNSGSKKIDYGALVAKAKDPAGKTIWTEVELDFILGSVKKYSGLMTHLGYMIVPAVDPEELREV